MNNQEQLEASVWAAMLSGNAYTLKSIINTQSNSLTESIKIEAMIETYARMVADMERLGAIIAKYQKHDKV